MYFVVTYTKYKLGIRVLLVSVLAKARQIEEEKRKSKSE